MILMPKFSTTNQTPLWEHPQIQVLVSLETLYNHTESMSADLVFEAPTLQILVKINSTQAVPVKNITLQGLGFRDAVSAVSYT